MYIKIYIKVEADLLYVMEGAAKLSSGDEVGESNREQGREE